MTPKLYTTPQPMWGPNMIWNFLVVTERVNKIHKTEMREHVCVNEDDIKDSLKRFFEGEIRNKDAERGTHYNIAVYSRDQSLETKILNGLKGTEVLPKDLEG